MRADEAYQHIAGSLIGQYGDREAANMARLLLEDGFHIPDPIRNQRLLTGEERRDIEGALRRLLRNEPLQYVLGHTWFYGLKLQVDQRVLIPRPETEELVYHILQSHTNKPLRLLDVGTGSGCIALALKKQRPRWEIQAGDVSLEALDLSHENARSFGLDLEFIHFDLMDENTWNVLKPADIVVSNPPYIPPADATMLAPNVVQYEPSVALFTTGYDPLGPYQKLLYLGQRILQRSGAIYMECHERYATDVARMFQKGGYGSVHILRDMQGKERMLSAQRK